MSLVDWLTGRDLEGPPEQRALEQMNVTDIAAVIDAAIEATEGAADETIPTVYRSAQILSDTIASLPMQEIDESTGLARMETRAHPGHGTRSLLRKPDPFEPYQVTMAKVGYSLVFRGNAYLWARSFDQSENPTAIYVLNPDEVSVGWDTKRLRPTYQWRGREMAPNREIWPISINHYPGMPEGVGPIRAAALTMRSAKLEGNYGRSLYEDGALPSGAVKVQQQLTATEADEVLDMFLARHKGKRGTGVLSGGADFQPFQINPVDAEFLQSRQFTVAELARMMGLPGPFLGVELGGSLTYSTAETLMRWFVNTTLQPSYLSRIAAVFSEMLPRGASAQFMTGELLQADTQMRYSSYKQAIDAGFLTVNEVRHMEGLGPIPGGDRPMPTESSQNGSNGRVEVTNVN